MVILPENPLRFHHLFDANEALKAKRYAEAFDRMEKLVNNAAYSKAKLTPSERRLLPIVFKSRVDSLSSDKLELKNVCLRTLKLLNETLIPLAAHEKESHKLYLKMKSDCYWYLAKAREGASVKSPVTRKSWRI